MKKREAKVVRYYKEIYNTTEEDYIVIYIKSWDEEKKKYYWGMSKSWDYKDMIKFSQNQPSYNIAEELFKDLYELQWFGYSIEFKGKKIKEGQGKWDYEEEDD